MEVKQYYYKAIAEATPDQLAAIGKTYRIPMLPVLKISGKFTNKIFFKINKTKILQSKNRLL